jgi:hypothetical protein
MSDEYHSIRSRVQAGCKNYRLMTAKGTCEQLDQLKRDLVSALLEAKGLRLLRDVSIQEDARVSRGAYKKADALIKHLLVGHGGKPCPAGDRPIVTATEPFRGNRRGPWAGDLVLQSDRSVKAVDVRPKPKARWRT